MGNPITSTPLNQPYAAALFAAPDKGYANDNGIVFSSLNIHGNIPDSMKPVSNPIATISIQSQSSKPIDSSMQSSNVNNFIDIGSINPPANPSFSQLPGKPSKPQLLDSSSAFTFAPLLAVSMLQTSQQTANSSINTINQVQQLLPSSTKPANNNNPMPKPSVRCGITKYTNSRVVGGSITQIGMIINNIH